jgi:hypothetical protein
MKVKSFNIQRATFQRIFAWASVSAFATMLIIPLGASAAGQLSARSASPASSAAATSTTYVLVFTPSATTTIGSILVEICDSPLQGTTCAASASAGVASNGASLVPATTTGPTGTGWTGGTWGKGATTGPGVTGTSVKYTNSGTAINPTNAQPGTWTFASVLNPAGANQQYFLRVTTYTDTAYTTVADFGAMALSTTATLNVTANVQETLTFCTGTAGALCTTPMSGTAVKIGANPGTSNDLSTTPTGGTSLMHIDTNAVSGYAISYLVSSANGFAYNTNTIQAANNQTMAVCAAGATNNDCFGLNLMNNATPAVGAATTGAAGYGVPTIQTGYGTIDSFKFVTNAAQPVVSYSGPTVRTDYTVTYAARSGATTKAGSYSANFQWIATGTF